MQGPVERELGKAEEVLVETANGDGVYLDRIKAVLESRVDARKHVLDLSETRHVGELCGIERVERDVDARETGILQIGRHLGEQYAIGRERNVLDSRRSGDLAYEVNHAFADEWLATCETHPANARLRRAAREVGDLLDAQDGLVRSERHALLGHAVYAAQIAAICQRDAQIVNLAPVIVLHVAPSKKFIAEYYRVLVSMPASSRK